MALEIDPDTLSPQDYMDALITMSEKLPDNHLAMLQAHYRAPNHKISARQMAEAVGYPNVASANLQYGTLAGRLCDIINYRPEGDNVYVLANLIRPEIEGNPEWLWEMRPQLAKALEQLGWV
jgi:hypothetical protein